MQQILDLINCPFPSIGIDLDGTIDGCPLFFRLLSHIWKGNIYIITMRNDLEKTKNDLNKFDVKYTDIILVKSFEEKSEVIVELGILVYFDDQPEMLKNIPEDRNIFLVRNGGNFDFEDKKWMMSNDTGKILY